MSSARSLVKKHTEKSGTDSHFEEDSEGIRIEIEYTVYDCTHCGAEGITSKARHDTWEEVAFGVRDHLSLEHPDIAENE